MKYTDLVRAARRRAIAPKATFAMLMVWPTLIAALAGLSTSFARTAQPDRSCGPVGDIRFICGRSTAEDMVAIPDTDWIIASAYIGAVGLRLISVHQEKDVALLFPAPEARKKQDMAIYGACPGPLSATGEAMFVAHGLALKKLKNRSFALYVVHHGARESIEVFDLEVPRGERPVITWVGCAVAPDGAVFNSVAALPGGGFVATNFWRRNPEWQVPAILITHEISSDPLMESGAAGMWEKLRAGQDTGDVEEWQPSSGWRKLPGSDSSAPNGIEVSRDGKFVYVPLSGSTKLLRLSRGASPPRRDEVEIGADQDNIHWTPDGKNLLVVARGRGGSGSRVLSVNPDTLGVTTMVEWSGPATVGYQMGHDMWIGDSHMLRIAIIPIPPQQ